MSYKEMFERAAVRCETLQQQVMKMDEQREELVSRLSEADNQNALLMRRVEELEFLLAKINVQVHS